MLGSGMLGICLNTSYICFSLLVVSLLSSVMLGIESALTFLAFASAGWRFLC
jgi:hypothetical protein